MGFVLSTYLHGGDKALLVKQKEEEGEVAVAPWGFGSLRERAGSSCQSLPPRAVNHLARMWGGGAGGPLPPALQWWRGEQGCPHGAGPALSPPEVAGGGGGMG